MSTENTNIVYDEDKIFIPKDLEGKLVRVIVRNKKDVRKFEKFIEKINDQGPYEMKVVENLEFSTIGSLENIESEDTMSILHSYIDETDVTLDKTKVKNIINDIYKSALDMV